MNHEEHVIYKSELVKNQFKMRLSGSAKFNNKMNLPYEAYQGSRYAFGKLVPNASHLKSVLVLCSSSSCTCNKNIGVSRTV